MDVPILLVTIKPVPTGPAMMKIAVVLVSAIMIGMVLWIIPGTLRMALETAARLVLKLVVVPDSFIALLSIKTLNKGPYR